MSEGKKPRELSKKSRSATKSNIPVSMGSHINSHKRKKNQIKVEHNVAISFKGKRKKIESSVDEEIDNKKTKTTNFCCSLSSSEGLADHTEDCNDSESVQSMSWNFSKKDSNEADSSLDVVNLKNNKVKEEIKSLFLVDMPSDFYSFYEFCKFFEKSHCLESLRFGELELVGPFDVLSGKVNFSVDSDSYLCHWRFFYDPPEFQTVLASESGYHIGYWRDEPQEKPVFLASNNSNENCFFKIEAENIFGAVFHHLEEFKRSSDPFKEVKTAKLQLALKDWAEKNKFTLRKRTSKINARQKKIVSKSFHGAGIVVPVEAKTKLGYRPLLETDVGLKSICNFIMNAKSENERESLWENLQPLITAANIANDECDFGNSLELGINLFCMGSPVFHETVEHLLATAYSLLNRTEFEKIIRAHLKFRRKDIDLSL